MAIQRFENKGAVNSSAFEGFFIGLNNGDRVALEQVMQKWNFRDEESFIRFAIALMVKAEGNRIWIQINGLQTILTPNENLLQRPNNPQ